MSARRLMLWLHGWIGITVGTWLAIVGLTGAILIWRPEAQPVINARLAQVTPGPGQVGLEAMYQAVRRAYPDDKVDRIFPASQPDRAVEFRIPTRDASVFVNQYDGRILGELPQRRNFFNTVDELHVRMLSQEVGHTLVGIAGFFLAAMAVSGAWLWWPRRRQWKRAFVPQWKTNWRGRNYELHRVLGAFTCLFLLAYAVTGITLVWSEPTRAVLGKFLGPVPKEPKAKAKKGEWLPLDDLLARSQAALPGGQFTRITWPKKAGAPLVFREQMPGELNPAGNSSVSIDPVTGKILKMEDSRQAGTVVRILNLRYPIHTGLWGGTLMRVIYTGVGLSLPFFYFSGWILWVNKRRKKGGKRKRVTRADAEIASVSVA